MPRPRSVPSARSESYDVIVVGTGNAGFCAALAAGQANAKVLLLERAPEEWIGGNTYFTAGAIRTTFTSVDDLRPLLVDPDPEQLAMTDVNPYTPADFLADMERVTAGRCNPTLSGVLVNDIAGTVKWMRESGIGFRLAYERQSFLVDGRYRFWGGLTVVTDGGGKGMIDQFRTAAERADITIRFETPVTDLIRDRSGAMTGVASNGDRWNSRSVVLASGGFEADAGRRAQFLGERWRMAKVRGTPHNTGDPTMAAIESGADRAGDWQGCHSTAWDAAAPPHGDRVITHGFTKQAYPYGIVVNTRGERFVDEGADFRNYTYAKYGAEILYQPKALAFQLFDAKTIGLLRDDEYVGPAVSRHEAETIPALAEKMGVPVNDLTATVAAFNEAVQPGAFNPAVKDGKHTIGIAPPKSNWAAPLDTPPFVAFPVTCGVTFTFGGLRIDPDARVLDTGGQPIAGLFAAGESVGDLFHGNYPGGSGLAAGAVFGRRAGRSAAAHLSTTSLQAASTRR